MDPARNVYSLTLDRYRVFCLVGFGVIWQCAAVASAFADESVYGTQVKPVLVERCYACHGALKQQSGLRLDTVAFMRKGGESGAVISPIATTSEPLVESSLLLERILSQDESVRMPPEGEPLKTDQIDAIRRWLASGAPGPENEEPERDPQEHWAFQAPKRPSIPAHSVTAENPIDYFLEEKRKPLGLVAVGPVDKRLWLRRVTLDLIGLPPTSQEIEDFLKDDSAEGYRLVIDRLLSSPHYGERWGRHWMDIWRYSDWWGLGAEVRNSQKHMWHWRDWIIDSLQQDKGYDQMIREMIAADELYPNDLDRLRATGFLARQYFRFNRTTWLDETIEHTSKAFLGLTFNCAKCHDHKYDPIEQEDYYRFRAIFEPYQVRLEMVPGKVDFESDAIPRAFDCNLDAKTMVHIRGDERRPDSQRVVSPGIPKVFGPTSTFVPTQIQLPLESTRPGLRSYVLENYLRRGKERLDSAEMRMNDAMLKRADMVRIASENADAELPTKVREELNQLEGNLRVHKLEWLWAHADLTAIPLRYAADRSQSESDESAARMTMQQAAVAERWVAWRKANWELEVAAQAWAEGPVDKKPELEKKRNEARERLVKMRDGVAQPGLAYVSLRGADKTPESNVESEESRTRPFPESSTGRRTAFANWLTRENNPLTSRVAVNHIWARHFGRPLVPTLFDFGRKGTLPTHPELLDWLAVEFEESGWSMKHLHRLMLTSQAYRMSSSQRGASQNHLETDPENRFFWRMNSMRMESQVVRDSLLHLADDLDTTVGGPSVAISQEDSKRRSIYFFHSHNEHERFLSNFDDANVLDCYRRASSIVPQQALALENSPVVNSMASKIAARIEDALGVEEPNRLFVEAAFQRILAYPPSEQELRLIESAVEELHRTMVSLSDKERDKAVEVAIVRALLNHNDFITIR